MCTGFNYFYIKGKKRPDFLSVSAVDKKKIKPPQMKALKIIRQTSPLIKTTLLWTPSHQHLKGAITQDLSEMWILNYKDFSTPLGQPEMHYFNMNSTITNHIIVYPN